LCERYQVGLTPSVSIMMMVRGRDYGRSGAGNLLAFGGAEYSREGGRSRGRGGSTPARGTGVSSQSRQYYAGKSDTRGLGGYYQNLGIEWQNLPGTLQEVQRIRDQAYGAGRSTLITGADVREQRIKELSRSGALASYAVLHLALHGYYDAEFPAMSSVVFSEVCGTDTGSRSEDGYLSVEEVTGLRLRAELVNLSACETGLGKLVKGDGVVGLSRAFMVAGANRVGVTLWPVDDEATKEIMVRVYRRMAGEGMRLAEALAVTKREFIKSADFSDPYFWSPFVLYAD
jgi:CHAT domain-containing protein